MGAGGTGAVRGEPRPWGRSGGERELRAGLRGRPRGWMWPRCSLWARIADPVCRRGRRPSCGWLAGLQLLVLPRGSGCAALQPASLTALMAWLRERGLWW